MVESGSGARSLRLRFEMVRAEEDQREERGAAESWGIGPEGRLRTRSSFVGRYDGRSDGRSASDVSEGRVRVNVGNGGKAEMTRVVAIVSLVLISFACVVLVVVGVQVAHLAES
jgi:hypothetical protein